MNTTESKNLSAMTLTELVEHFTTGVYDRYSVERVDPDKNHAYVSDSWGGGLSVSPDNFGVTVVIGQLRWGKGADLAAAKREFKRQGAVLGNGYYVYEFPAETMFCGVTGMGGIHWIGEEPTCTEVQPRGKK